MFNLDGTMSRKRETPCKQCGAVEHCDICWEHVSDWSPFMIWNCLLCQMPQFVYDETGGCVPVRCGYCGWDEATECGSTEYETENGKLVAYEIKYDPETREIVSRTRKEK